MTLGRIKNNIFNSFTYSFHYFHNLQELKKVYFPIEFL